MHGWIVPMLHIHQPLIIVSLFFFPFEDPESVYFQRFPYRDQDIFPPGYKPNFRKRCAASVDTDQCAISLDLGNSAPCQIGQAELQPLL